jgi:SecD/SecF fusion protein
MILSGMEFNLLSITAILTISGYSLNDTVVIFDRIRENLKLIGRMTFSDMINLSLNETLNRTVNTGGTTLTALLPVYFIGGEVLHDFSLSLVVGIVVGTYSSIFIAAALLTEWQLMTAPPPKTA